MTEVVNPTISILTATYNAAEFLPALIESLQKQTDTNFCWIVADGASTDGTIDLLQSSINSISSLVIDSRPDQGISDGINRAIKLTNTDYYIILGADDLLHKDAINNFKKALIEHQFPDVLVSTVVTSKGVVLKTRWPHWLWLFGSPAKVASTSVGTAYKRVLIEKVGFFDTRYKIYADGLFMLKAIKSGASIRYADFVAGVFYIGGISNSNQFLSYTEEFRAKLACGYNIYMQFLIFALKIIRAHYRNKLNDL